MTLQAVITERRTFGNSFGDKTFEVVVELRGDHGSVLDFDTFRMTAYEGDHEEIKRLMTTNINIWARKRSGSFTGRV